MIKAYLAGLALAAGLNFSPTVRAQENILRACEWKLFHLGIIKVYF